MAEPSSLFTWATDARYDPLTGFANKVKPSYQLQQTGLKATHNVNLKNEGLGDGWLNYQMDLISTWIDHLRNLYPVNTVKSFTTNIAASSLDAMYGGTWSQIGNKTINSVTVYYYERTA